VIDLNSNRLQTFDFNELHNLENLNLSKNHINSVDGIFCGKNSMISYKLRKLSLSNNSFISLPENAFENVTGLHTLLLASDNLIKIPDCTFNGLINLI
jgi:Leucine-rich repeat (LRR) protein